jgi:uncharacterized protein (TIGR00369 family)
MPRITGEEFLALVDDTLPLASRMNVAVEALGDGAATLRLPFSADYLRPGGTIAGPMLMLLADLAAYAAVMTAIGRVELAVTTSFTINFLMKPPPADLVAEARLLKCGRRLAVAEIRVRAVGESDLLGHATATYSIPPNVSA